MRNEVYGIPNKSEIKYYNKIITKKKYHQNLLLVLGILPK